MAYRIAKSLATLREQINAASPNRSKASDGWIGDAAHSSRTSDHNPDASDIVRALDITHDLAHGVDGDKLAAALIASQDPRIKYIIWGRRIISGRAGPSPWVWRPYSGANPHTKHLHLSVVSTAAGDDGKAWAIDLGIPLDKAVAPAKPSRPVLRLGDKGEEVRELQRLLNISADGDFGAKTRAAVIAFQEGAGLVADGIVGAYTWEALEARASASKPAPTPAPAPKPQPSPAAAPGGFWASLFAAIANLFRRS